MKLFLTLISVSSLLTVFMLLLWRLRKKRGTADTDSKNFLILGIGGVVITVVLLICLFKIEKEIIKASESTIHFKCVKVRVGEYSEEVKKPGCTSSSTTDCWETRTWEIPCSEVVWTRMKDHKLVKEDLKGLVKKIDVGRGLLCPEDPPQTKEVPKKNLDGIVVKTTKEYTIDMVNQEGKIFTDSVNPLRYFQLLEDKKQRRGIIIERLGHWVISNKTVFLVEAE